MKDEFLEAMSRAANSVTVVTTDGVAGRLGVTVSAMCSVSVEDPSPLLTHSGLTDLPALWFHKSPMAVRLKKQALKLVT